MGLGQTKESLVTQDRANQPRVYRSIKLNPNEGPGACLRPIHMHRLVKLRLFTRFLQKPIKAVVYALVGIVSNLKLTGSAGSLDYLQ